MVDYSGLENRRAERHRGFESLSLRNQKELSNFAKLLLNLDAVIDDFSFLFSLFQSFLEALSCTRLPLLCTSVAFPLSRQLLSRSLTSALLIMD